MQLNSYQDPDKMLAWLGHRWPAVLGAVLAAYVVTNVLQAVLSFITTSRALASVPTAPESSWLLGNAIALAANSPWEKMNEWVLAEPAGIIKVRALNVYMVIVGSPQGMKQVFQTKQRDYGKDVSLSYQHFLNILGSGPTSGLVTAEGEHWRRQRSLMGPTLRTDILDAVIGIGKRAADRLSQKLKTYRASGQVIDMEEEFRLLTLQVIGEAMLSLPPEECDEVRCLGESLLEGGKGHLVVLVLDGRDESSLLVGCECPLSFMQTRQLNIAPTCFMLFMIPLLSVYTANKLCCIVAACDFLPRASIPQISACR